MSKKNKIIKPRDWAMVHLINRNGGGIHDKREKRSKQKCDLKKKIKQFNLEEI